MNIFYILLGLVLGVGVAWLAWRQVKTGRFCDQQNAEKEDRKEKVIELLRAQGELGNDDIRDALGVSARTVVNYMDELERAGKVEQVGETGHAVVYRLK